MPRRITSLKDRTAQSIFPITSCQNVLRTSLSAVRRSKAKFLSSLSLMNGISSFFLQVNGQAIMPGGGFFEAASAAAAVGVSASSGVTTSIRDVTIPAPLALQHRSTALLECTVDCMTGMAEVSTTTSKQKHTHCRGFICRVLPGEPSCWTQKASECMDCAFCRRLCCFATAGLLLRTFRSFF